MTDTGFWHNGAPVSAASPGSTPLLWVLREELRDVSARFGCGEAQCGSCMVRIDGRAKPSCDVSLAAVEGRRVDTAAGLIGTRVGNALIEAFEARQAGQCGYCLPGVLMAAAELLDHEPAPTVEQVGSALAGNLCRCGTHTRILAAIADAAQALRAASP